MTEFNIFSEIERVTEEVYGKNNAALDVEVGEIWMAAEFAGLTFADIEDGEEFKDSEGNTWEKRSDEYAIAWEWEDGHRMVRQEFNPTDRVTR